ncbi:MAG: HlyD family efflux transporter periplasmic adaptor subunit, partial [Oscillospiraceae bacterium]
QTISAIDAEIATLKSQVSNNIKTIKSPDSAYFSNAVDGYEQLFTPASLKDLSIKKIEDNLKNKKVKKPDSVGKSIPNFGWDFVCLIDAKESQYFKKGQQIKLKFSVNSVKEIDTFVKDVIIEDGQKKAALVFSGEYIDEDFITMRFEKPKAVVANYDGILIPKKAIRFETKTVEEVDEKTKEKKQVEKQVKGVYTLLGKTVCFKEVDSLYEDEFTLVSKVKDDNKFVNVYDKVITRGKDLDGTKK